MSITAATPWRSPWASRTTGMPPPPTATTTNPASRRTRIASISTIRFGSGDGTTRRHPRSASSTTCHPSSSRRRFASSSVRNEPIGFVGWANAGSSGSTSTWVTTDATSRRMPRTRKSLTRFWASMYPIDPCVSATQISKGTSWSSWRASSERRRMNPTWGPFPWLMATSQPSATRPPMWWSVSFTASYWSSTDLCWASRIRLLPPIATTIRPGVTTPPLPSWPHIVSAITAFCTCRRFSAWSNTALWGPSKTPSVTSMLRSAGSGCM